MASERSNQSPSEPAATRGYTLELCLRERKVVIVGGGKIGRRKVPELLRAGADIRLIDPAALPDLPPAPNLRHQRRDYHPTDLDDATLVFAATADPHLNARIARDAAQRRIPCCRIDSAQESDFISPARLECPPLTLTVSTGGTNPAMAAALRTLLEGMIPDSWQIATELTALIRQKLLTEQLQVPYNQQVLLQLFDQGLLEQIEQRDGAAIDRLLTQYFGAGFTLTDLQFSFPEGTS